MFAQGWGYSPFWAMRNWACCCRDVCQVLCSQGAGYPEADVVLDIPAIPVTCRLASPLRTLRQDGVKVKGEDGNECGEWETHLEGVAPKGGTRAQVMQYGTKSKTTNGGAGKEERRPGNNTPSPHPLRQILRSWTWESILRAARQPHSPLELPQAVPVAQVQAPRTGGGEWESKRETRGRKQYPNENSPTRGNTGEEDRPNGPAVDERAMAWPLGIVPNSPESSVCGSRHP